MDSVQLSLSSADGNLLEINEKTVTRAMNSYLCSAKYLRHVVPLTMFYIVHNRIAYDSKYFIKANIKDWNYVILNKKNSHDELDNLYTWAYGAMEALQKGCLTQLFLKIIDNNETVEYYRYSFLYCKNPSVTRPKGSNKDIVKITKDWFENFSILKVLAKLPSNAKLSVEVVLKEKPDGLILLNYIETGKSDVYDQDNEEGVKNLMRLGEISTNFHKVRAYCKIKSIQASTAASICSSDGVEIIEDDSLDQVGLVQVEACNESTAPNLGPMTDNARLNIDNVLTDNIPKRSKKKAIKHNENDNISIEKEAPIKEVSKENVPRKEPTVSSDLTGQSITELLTQNIINCKKKYARKEQNKTATLFGDTTIEVVEEENSVCTRIVPPNASSIQSLDASKSNKSNTNDDRSNTLEKKLKRKASKGKKDTIIHEEGECDIGKTKETISRESPINLLEQPTLESTAPKVIKPGEKTNLVAILKDISIPANLPAQLIDECDNTLDYTSPSELYINNELAPKAKRKAKKYIKSQVNLAKKSKTNSIDLQKDAPNRENESSTNNMSKRNFLTKSAIHSSDLNKLIFPQPRNIGSGSLIEDHRNQLEHNSSPIPSDLVQTTLNEEPKKAPDQLIHTEMYTDKITSLTPKKSKAKRKARGNTKSETRATKKPKSIIAHNGAHHQETDIINDKKSMNESISTKLPKYKRTESFDSTTLEKEVKKIPSTIKQPLVDSTQLGGSQFIELLPAATELNGVNISTYKDKQITYVDDDYHSISSRESDMLYINNRVV